MLNIFEGGSVCRVQHQCLLLLGGGGGGGNVSEEKCGQEERKEPLKFTDNLEFLKTFRFLL